MDLVFVTVCSVTREIYTQVDIVNKQKYIYPVGNLNSSTSMFFVIQYACCYQLCIAYVYLVLNIEVSNATCRMEHRHKTSPFSAGKKRKLLTCIHLTIDT